MLNVIARTLACLVALLDLLHSAACRRHSLTLAILISFKDQGVSL
jgi:hypothetical protein